MKRLISCVTVLLFPASLAFGYCGAQWTKHLLTKAADVMQTR